MHACIEIYPKLPGQTKLSPLEKFKFRYVLINLLSYIQVIKLHIWCRIERELPADFLE